jgi:chromatin remodeling complex protein RSC6
MSGLTKRMIYADRHLSAILGVNEGSLVSYAEISKGIHAYIKKNDLKNPKSVKTLEPSSTEEEVTVIAQASPSPETPTQIRECRDCGEPIPADAIYCDMCGIEQ